MAVKWGMAYGEETCDVYDSLDEALHSALLFNGDEVWPRSVEHEGQVITPSHPEWQAAEERFREEELREAVRPATHLLEVQDPNGNWFTIYGLADSIPSSGVREEMDELTQALGPDRVRIVPIRG